MSIHSINPDTLKMYREQAKMTRQELYDKSKISKKTIARIEGGKASANTNTLEKLAKALNVKPEALSKPFTPEVTDHIIGYRRIRIPFQENTVLALQMVEKYYGINLMDQLAMAPLMSALLAESSLVWRKQKLEAAEEAAKTLDAIDYGHLGFKLGASDVEDFICAESESIEQKDIFGQKVTDFAIKEHSLPTEEANPFVEYLRYLTNKSDNELIRAKDEGGDGWDTANHFSNGSVYYSINAIELDRLVGENEWAARALQWGHVSINDIPENLLGDDVSKQRAEWLENRIPKEKREEYEAYWDKIRSEINITLFDDESEKPVN